MAHQRLRRFDSGLIYGAPGAGREMSLAVKAGREVFLRGLTGLDLDGKFVGEGDVVAQAEQALRNAKALLEEAGAQPAHVCKVTTYVTDRAWLAPVEAVVARHLGRTVATRLIVNGLALPGMLVELDIDAVIPGGAA